MNDFVLKIECVRGNIKMGSMFDVRVRCRQGCVMLPWLLTVIKDNVSNETKILGRDEHLCFA